MERIVLKEITQTAQKLNTYKLLSDDGYLDYLRSVTELEMNEGILKTQNLDNRSFVVFREIKFIDNQVYAFLCQQKWFDDQKESVNLLNDLKRRMKDHFASQSNDRALTLV